MENMINRRRNIIKVLGLGIYDYNSMIAAYNNMSTSKQIALQSYNTLFKECILKVRTLCSVLDIEIEDVEMDEPKTDLGKIVYQMEEKEFNFNYDKEHSGFDDVKRADYFLYVEKQTIKLFTATINLLSQDIDVTEEEFIKDINRIRLNVTSFFRGIYDHYSKGIINPYLVVKNYMRYLRQYSKHITVEEFITYTHSTFSSDLPNPSIIGKNAVVDYAVIEQIIMLILNPKETVQSYDYLYYNNAQYNVRPIKYPLVNVERVLNDNKSGLVDLLIAIRHEKARLEAKYISDTFGANFNK